MTRLQHTFKQEMNGVGASLEKRWKFCGFEGLKTITWTRSQESFELLTECAIFAVRIDTFPFWESQSLNCIKKIGGQFLRTVRLWTLFCLFVHYPNKPFFKGPSCTTLGGYWPYSLDLWYFLQLTLTESILIISLNMTPSGLCLMFLPSRQLKENTIQYNTIKHSIMTLETFIF